MHSVHLYVLNSYEAFLSFTGLDDRDVRAIRRSRIGSALARSFRSKNQGSVDQTLAPRSKHCTGIDPKRCTLRRAIVLPLNTCCRAERGAEMPSGSAYTGHFRSALWANAPRCASCASCVFYASCICASAQHALEMTIHERESMLRLPRRTSASHVLPLIVDAHDQYTAASVLE